MDTQSKLLAVPDLTLKKTLEIAQGSEAAVKTDKFLKDGEVEINSVAKLKVKCDCCGKSNKRSFQDVDCHHCGKHGYIAGAYKSKKGWKAQIRKYPPHKNTSRSRDTKYITVQQKDKSPKDHQKKSYSCKLNPVTHGT